MSLAEKTSAIHVDRKISEFRVSSNMIEVFMSKHGHFRILEQKNISPQQLGDYIASIGGYELGKHFKKAQELFPLDQRSHIDWKTRVDYTIVLYDTVNEITLLLGLHPHLNRITVITIIPRVDNVGFRNVYGFYLSYRTNRTWSETIKLPYMHELKPE